MQNPLLLVTEPRTRDTVIWDRTRAAALRSLLLNASVTTSQYLCVTRALLEEPYRQVNVKRRFGGTYYHFRIRS
jgi:hypothetical protein